MPGDRQTLQPSPPKDFRAENDQDVTLRSTGLPGGPKSPASQSVAPHEQGAMRQSAASSEVITDTNKCFDGWDLSAQHRAATYATRLVRYSMTRQDVWTTESCNGHVKSVVIKY